MRLESYVHTYLLAHLHELSTYVVCTLYVVSFHKSFLSTHIYVYVASCQKKYKRTRQFFNTLHPKTKIKYCYRNFMRLVTFRTVMPSKKCIYFKSQKKHKLFCLSRIKLRNVFIFVSAVPRSGLNREQSLLAFKFKQLMYPSLHEFSWVLQIQTSKRD